MSVLKLKLRNCRSIERGNRDALYIPATMCLQTLVVTSTDCFGELCMTDSVILNFEDPDGSGRSLTDLFVAGSLMVGNMMLMADALYTRGLMLGAVQCPNMYGGVYVYLKRPCARGRTWEGLLAEYVDSCACGACWKCCQAAVQV
jgi:hypothetical protein